VSKPMTWIQYYTASEEVVDRGQCGYLTSLGNDVVGQIPAWGVHVCVAFYHVS
jgi:hypothetical protein